MGKQFNLSPQQSEPTSAQGGRNGTREFTVLKKNANLVEGRLASAEFKITPEAITSTVTNASTTEPTSPFLGMLWVDTSITPNQLKRWNGTAWVNTSITSLTQLGGEPTIHKATTAPSTPTEGKLWLDTSVVPNILNRYTGGVWVSANFTQSQIEQTANSISSSVVANYAYSKGQIDTTLTEFSTIEQTSQSITSSVGFYNTNTVQPALNDKADLSALANYSTITQTANDITLAVNTRRSRNLFTNSDFENGLTDWTAMGAGTVLMDGSANTTLDGGKNLLIDTVTGVMFAGVYKYVSGLTVGKKYTLSGYFYNESNFAIYSDSAGSGLTSLPGGGWTRSSVTFTATSATAELLYIISNGASTGSGACYMDRLQLEEGEVMTVWNPAPSEMPTATMKGSKFILNGIGAKFIGDGMGWYAPTDLVNPKVYFDTVNSKFVFDGKIIADAGTIGGFTLGATKFTAGATNATAVGVASGETVAFWAGHLTPGSAPFRVTRAGALTATSGTLAGWTLSAGALTSASGAVKLDGANNRIYLNTTAYLYAGTSASDILTSGSLSTGGAFYVGAGQIASLGSVVRMTFGASTYLITRDTNGFLKATTLA